MNRRAFLGWLGGTAAGVAAASALDVERLLWVPGEKTIFLPPDRAIRLYAGDMFEIAGIKAIGPHTGRYMDMNQWFCVTQNVTSGAEAIEHAYPKVHPAILNASAMDRRRLGSQIVEWKAYL